MKVFLAVVAFWGLVLAGCSSATKEPDVPAAPTKAMPLSDKLLAFLETAPTDVASTLRANGYDEPFVGLGDNAQLNRLLNGGSAAEPWQIEGRVLDASSGKPLEGVVVRTIEPVLYCDGKAGAFHHEGIVTDAQGTFVLRVPDDVTRRQIGMALATPRGQAEALGLHFGTMDVELRHPDYLGRNVGQAAANVGTVELVPERDVVKWIVMARDSKTNELIADASVMLELVADPHPAGPQRLTLPLILVLGTAPERARGRVEAPSYAAQEFDQWLELGEHEQVFSLVRQE